MEKYIIKGKIKNLLDDRISIEEIRKNYGIDEDIISEFEEEEKIKEQIVKLLEEEKIDEAKQLIDSMESEAFRLHLLVKVAENAGDNLEREKILRKILEIEPDNVRSMSSLINILRGKLEKAIINKDKDLQINISSEIKELAERQLKVEPNNAYAHSSIIKYIRVKIRNTPDNEKEEIENLKEREKEELKSILRIDHANIKAMNSLLKIAKVRNEVEEQKELLHRILEINPNDELSKARLMKILAREKNSEAEKIIIKYSDTSLIEETMANEAENPLEKARRIIYETKDILTDSEQIKELIDGESELNKNLVLAELYLSTGLQKRAEGLLKGYKKQLDLENDKDKVSLINQALEIIKGSNKKTKGSKTKWQAFWDQKNEKEKSKIEEENTEFEEVPYHEDAEER